MQKRKKSANRFLALLLSVMMLIGMLPMTVFAAQADLTIETLEQFQNFAEQVNGGDDFEGKTVVLAADINLGGENSPWTPIGTSSKSFKGTFDGGRHVVSGLYIASGSKLGLFGEIGDKGTVKNVTVQGKITTASNHAAGIAGNNNGTIENCASAVGVTCTGKFVYYHAGIAGENGGTIRGCVNRGAISGYQAIGGIVGRNFGGTVESCYNTGAVTGSGKQIGGIVGQNRNGGLVKNTYSTGKVTGPADSGAIIGEHQSSADEENNYYLENSAAYGLGNASDTTGIKTSADMQTLAFVKTLGDAFMADKDGINNGYPVLTWQEIVPDVIIATYEQLKAFADQVNDGEAFEGKLIRLDANIALGGESSPWTPIGTSSKPFKGTFDGGNHIISELYIASGSNVGLFGYVNGGIVQNLTVQGSVKGNSAVAGVVGALNGGTVKNCGNQASVSGGSGVGGVVGDASNGTCVISGCYNAGAISGTTGFIGGVTGKTFGTATISDCYNTGTITGPATVGGVAGGHKGRGTACANCYNTGKVVDATGAKNNIGAILGGKGTLTNCYYLTGSYTQAVGADSAASGATETDSISAENLGDAFTAWNGKAALTWEPDVDTSAPVRPQFVEKTELSKQLAGYIRQAINSKKTNAGIASSETLLGNEETLNGASSTGTDWIALAMGRFGYFDQGDGNYYNLYDDGDGYQAYLKAMKDYIESAYKEQDGILHSVKATEWHRAVVAILALGGDPTAFGTYNGQPINLIADGSYACAIGDPGKQGINGWIWGLIAMDTGRFEVPQDAPFDRETFITEILKMQLTDGVNGNKYGGWVLGGYGSSSDVDITGMAIQALAPYYNEDTIYTYVNANSKEEVSKTVRECVDEAVERLSSMLNASGGFASWNTNNVESIAQVVVALTSLGIDITEDDRFISADGKTLLDGMLQFRLSDGGFCHVLNSGWNSMATDQAAYALVAIWRQQNGMRALYDMRGDWTQEETEAIENAVTVINSLPEPSDSQYKAKLKEALAAFRAVPADERQYVGNYTDLAASVEMVGGEDKLDTEEPYITRIEVTAQPDKTTYFEEDVFDPTGMVVTAYYSNGTSRALADTEYSYSPYGKLELTDKVIYITSGILKATVSITVDEKLPWDGAGTEKDPYLIKTADDLVTLDEYVRYKENAGTALKGLDTRGLHFKMTQDINLAGVDNWHAIGADHTYQNLGFCGHFDGDGHQIWNLNTVKTHNTNGLFGKLGDGALIENVGIASGNIGYGSETNNGAIAASAIGDAVIRNCWNYAAVSGSFSVGGILGEVQHPDDDNVPAITVTIENCYNMGVITAQYDGGGIIGRVGDSHAKDKRCRVIIRNSYNAGEVKGSGTFGNGGLIGNVRYCSDQTVTTIENCYNAGRVSGAVSGAILGSAPLSKVQLQNVHYLKDTNDQAVGVYEDNEQTIVGEAAAKTADEMKADAFVTAMGNAFEKDTNSLNNGYPILKGQQPIGEEAPVRAGLEIGTAEELAEFAARVNSGESFTNKTVALTAHIDLSSYDPWTPIGRSGAQFDGSFDGQGYVIDNLYVTKTEGGLFGVVGTNAVIRNVGIASGQIGLESYATNFLGGIAGWSNGADFINCWNGADIYAGGGYAGGIVGTVRDGGESLIQGCYNTGYIYSSNDGDLGGIVGHLSTSSNGTSVAVTIDSCYNLGEIYGHSGIGGIVGRAQDGHCIQNCYNTGKITAFYEFPNTGIHTGGAIVGSASDDNVVENCYYDTSACETAFGDGEPETDKVEGKSSQEMMSDEILALLGDGFKKDKLQLVNGGYPLVQWQKTEDADNVEDVIGKIDAIGTVTLDSAAAINEARNAYDGLDEELQLLVTNLSVLEAAENALAAMQTLEQAKETAAAQLESYKNPDSYREAQRAELIKAIADGKAAIAAATDVDNVSAALAAAKQAIDLIQTDEQLTMQEAAAAVSAKIDGLGEITLESEAAVREARNAYDALSDAAKQLVTNYGLLTKAEETLAALKNEKDDTDPETPSDERDPETPSKGDADGPVTGERSDLLLWGILLSAGLGGLLISSSKKVKQICSK